MKTTQTEYLGRTIISGFFMPGYWAKCGIFNERGYRTERQAVNAMKRRISKSLKARP